MFWELLIFLIFILLGGSCSLKGTWWSRDKKKKEEYQGSNSDK